MSLSQVQGLLRFASQDAKVPLSAAMGKVMELQKAGLTSVEQLAKTELKSLQEIISDDKIAKQLLTAAKRVSKKREASNLGENTTESPQKKSKIPNKKDSASSFDKECAQALPTSSLAEEELSNVVLLTNRAPLLLAFAVCVLKYTMPEQPISSRLSLAQAVVSANSRSKAVSIGIESGGSAEQRGWGKGQPTVKVLGRDIKTLKRWDYNPREGQAQDDHSAQGGVEIATDNNIFGQRPPDDSESIPAMWGVDLEAHRKTISSGRQTDNPLPIFVPDSARSYLLRSFTQLSPTSKDGSSVTKKHKVSQMEAEKEESLGRLLRSIDILCQSWASTLDKDELDRRAWALYLRVRPAVQSGVEGWGEKGQVKLSEILALQRQP